MVTIGPVRRLVMVRCLVNKSGGGNPGGAPHWSPPGSPYQSSKTSLKRSGVNTNSSYRLKPASVKMFVENVRRDAPHGVVPVRARNITITDVLKEIVSAHHFNTAFLSGDLSENVSGGG